MVASSGMHSVLEFLVGSWLTVALEIKDMVSMSIYCGVADIYTTLMVVWLCK